MMTTPTATYRVQLNQSFTLAHLKETLDYLQALGISHIYASPLLKAMKGSDHGYDVADPHRINPEIGTVAELQEVSALLQQKNMGWIQDIVPNHMNFSPANSLLMDVLERGSHSEYYRYFDIDWEHDNRQLKGRLMVPFLDSDIHTSIEQHKLQLAFTEYDGFTINHFDSKYPVSVAAYSLLLELLPADSMAYRQLQLLQQEASQNHSRSTWLQHKQAQLALIVSNRDVAESIKHIVERINNTPALLATLLQRQHYTFTWWRATEKQINYRRFFTVNSLICLSMEREDTFAHYHAVTHEWYRKGWIQGLRIDHIDGLKEPGMYIDWLRDLFGKDCFIVAEKILSSKEVLPPQWKLQGTSGYEFLAYINQLLTDRKGADQLTAFYRTLVPDLLRYDELIYTTKRNMLDNYMKGELDNLVTFFFKLELNGEGTDREMLTECLALFMCYLPVYRIYPEEYPLSDKEARLIAETFTKVQQKAPHLSSVITLLHDLFTEKGDGTLISLHKMLFIKRLMQFTGPLTAKGVEDTAFYIYNPLISHEEVGDSPQVLGKPVTAYHEQMKNRQECQPLSFNATSTHDTKRGEDARMRINVLAELWEDWVQQVKKWMEINAPIKEKINDNIAPTINDEYFIYQSLIGGFPDDLTITESFRNRITGYFTKVVREAKVNSNWAEPNTAYEEACIRFIEQLLNEQHSFLQQFVPFVRNVCRHAIVYSLVQVLLKATSPGIPDIYQGSELPDLAFVDPDNRAPVQYAIRKAYMNKLVQLEQGPVNELLDYVITHRFNGVEKMYLTKKVLWCRKQYPELFTQGTYIPLYPSDNQQVWVGYCRQHGSQWVMALAPLQFANRLNENGGISEEVYEGVTVALPDNAPVRWKNECTGEIVEANNRTVSLKELFVKFPVALLVSGE